MSLSRIVFALSLGLAALTGCGDDSGGGSTSPAPTPTPPPAPPPPPPPVATATEREIDPGQTGAGIASSALPHFVSTPNPAVAAKARLFVMLPGTAANPRNYREIVRTGASRGYHSLGLLYPNDEAVGTLCANSSDADCAGKIRREVVTGEDVSTLVAVDRANSIANRLAVLLSHLNSSFPNEGWGQYLSSGQPNWALITIAGHSQGGGHAAYMAKLFSLDRAVLFSAPADTAAGSNAPAQWISMPNVTPPERQYGFTHTADTLVSFTIATNNWQAAGLGASGAVVSVDGAAAPFGNSHMLATSAQPNPNPVGPTFAPTHGAPVADAVTPLTASGELLYRPVWVYLAFP